MEWEWEPSRKDNKKERKSAQAGDRSRFKKTDLDKKKEVPIPEDLPRGRVTCVRSDEVDVLLEGGNVIRCTVRGGLRKEDSVNKRVVVVGDWVRYAPGEETTGTIMAVEPRTTTLTRAEHFLRRKRQVVAANIDQVAIVMSMGIPALKPALIDRFLIAADKGGLRPLLLFTKVDLVKEYPDQAELLAELVGLYRGLGVAVVEWSMEGHMGLDQLLKELQGRTTVFSGQSGVGKSSIINTLTGRELRTASIIEATRKGQHTTSQAQMISLPLGGSVIDTPGLRSFGVWALGPEEVQSYFPEIVEAAQSCRYRDCTHSVEPDCGVLKALEEGRISDLRYDSYRTLRQGEGIRDLLDWLEAE